MTVGEVLEVGRGGEPQNPGQSPQCGFSISHFTQGMMTLVHGPPPITFHPHCPGASLGTLPRLLGKGQLLV